jgi:hypothetical protein
MITFATLFLGLCFGVFDVEVVTADTAASVQIVLDGRLVGQLDERPWKTAVDFGMRLAPHELVAVARDAKGKELGRAHQWVNRARAEAEASFVVEPGTGGTGRIARLRWQSAGLETPTSVTITFDGKPLGVADSREFSLPAYAPEQVHFLRAEVESPHNVSAVAEALLGGQRHDEALTSLTAVPILVDDGVKAPKLEALASAFTKSGATLRLVAIEEGPADAVFVVTHAATLALRRLLPANPNTSTARLRRNQSVRFVGTAPGVRDRPAALRVFPVSEEFRSATRGLLRMASTFAWSPDTQLVGDAVGLAAIIATRRDRRRAVVLLIGAEDNDESPLDARALRSFVHDIGVPLSVWSLTKEPTAIGRKWEPTVTATTAGLFDEAVHRLRDGLDRQRIVWVEGQHVLHEIDLAPEVKGFRIAR